MFRGIIILFAVVCTPSLYAAGECPARPIRLDAGSGSLQGVPVIDQGSMGICYACSAALMASASFPGGKAFCPISLAVDKVRNAESVTRDGTDPIIEGGDPCDALAAANRFGYCQNCGELYKKLQATSDSGSSWFNTMNDLYDSFLARTDREGNVLTNGIRYLLGTETPEDRTRREFITGMCTMTDASLRPHLRLPSTEVVTRILRAANPGEFFAALMENSCNPRGPGPNQGPTCTRDTGLKVDSLRNTLRNHFTSNRVAPLGIGYCANLFDSTKPERFHGAFPDPENGNKLRSWKALSAKGQIGLLMAHTKDSIVPDLRAKMATLNGKANLPLKNLMEKMINCFELRIIPGVLAKSGETEIQKAFVNQSTEVNRGSLPQELLNTSRTVCPDVATAVTGIQSNLALAEQFVTIIAEANSDSDTELESIRGCGAHSSVLTGVRCQGDRRQYLIRNSWGQKCSGYSHVTPPSHSECDETAGSIWVDENVLLQNMFDTSTTR